jgi:hypothetical protein
VVVFPSLASLDSDKCPKIDSAELGHFEAFWDIDQSFNLNEVQQRASHFRTKPGIWPPRLFEAIDRENLGFYQPLR